MILGLYSWTEEIVALVLFNGCQLKQTYIRILNQGGILSKAIQGAVHWHCSCSGSQGLLLVDRCGHCKSKITGLELASGRRPGARGTKCGLY